MSKKFTNLNCFLISSIINLAFLIFLSLYNENIQPKNENKFFIELISSSKGMVLKSYPDDEIKDNHSFGFDSAGAENGNYLSYETYRSIVREIAPISMDSKIVNSLKNITQDDLFYIKSIHNKVKASNRVQTHRNPEISIEKTINTRKSLLNVKDLINSLNGYYNISVVYMDSDSYELSKNILYQLANAMNKWTQIRTKVTNDRLRLDDLKNLKIPMIYMAVQKPFTFSENTRQNLQRYLSNGGFLLLSNLADSEVARLEVANSFGYELWKILGDNAHNLIEIEKNHPIFSYPFNIQNASLPDLLAITKEGKIFVIYEDTGYGKAWLDGINSKTEPFMKMGINIIVYMLITSEIFVN